MTSVKQFECNDDLLEMLLHNRLCEEQQHQLEEHLCECDRCSQHINNAASSQWSWDQVADSLPADEFDSSEQMHLLTTLGGTTQQTPPVDDQGMLTREISGWLDPTDDPQMLGRFAGYEIVGIIGHGGMGVVLKGFESSLNRFVAIKVLAPRLATNASARRRFAREAQAAAAVRHDNVIAVHRVDERHGLPFLVMPYVPGDSLQDRIDNEGPLSTEAVLRVASQVASGLAAAHAQGLVHRDIKPANILLENGVERVTITDFGLARAVDDVSITRTGIIAGTPQFMSPEQAQAKPLDHRSDLFSLGSVIYAMATGQPPFRSESSHRLLQEIIEVPIRDARQIEPSVPDWLVEIIVWLQQKDPEDRPQTAAEVADYLEKWIAHLRQPDVIPQPPRIPPMAGDSENGNRGSLRRWLMGAAGGFISIVLGIVIVWKWAKAPFASKAMSMMSRL